MKNLKKGFTLIELLVVVAIIGILASVVLASLTSARSKGKDAAIFAQLSNMRAQAELFYATNGNYGTTTSGTANFTCGSANAGGLMFTGGASDNGLAGLLAGVAQSLNGTSTLALNTEAVCNYTPTTNATSVTAWAVAVKGVTSGQAYCVDSTGASKSYTGLTGWDTSVVGAAGVGAVASAGATTCN